MPTLVSIPTETTTMLGAPSGDLRTYIARPPGDGPHPTMLVIHEAFGLTPHIESMTRRVAAAGFLAVAPDLCTNDPVRATLTEPDIEQAIAVLQADDREAVLQAAGDDRARVETAVAWLMGIRDRQAGYLADLQATLTWMQQRDDVRPNAVGAIGWCLGGGLSVRLAATGAPLAAAVIFYGRNPDLEDVPAIRCPVQGHYGTEDPDVTGPVPQLEEAMRAAGKSFEALVYEAPHAFNNDTRRPFTAEPAAISWARAIEFLHAHVR